MKANQIGGLNSFLFHLDQPGSPDQGSPLIRFCFLKREGAVSYTDKKIHWNAACSPSFRSTRSDIASCSFKNKTSLVISIGKPCHLLLFLFAFPFIHEIFTETSRRPQRRSLRRLKNTRSVWQHNQVDVTPTQSWMQNTFCVVFLSLVSQQRPSLTPHVNYSRDRHQSRHRRQ